MSKDLTLADALLEIARLRQGYWDARAIMGFDNDGDPTPVAVSSDFVAMMLSDARSMRDDYDDALRHVPIPFTVSDLGNAYRNAMQSGAKLNGEVKAGEEK